MTLRVLLLLLLCLPSWAWAAPTVEDDEANFVAGDTSATSVSVTNVLCTNDNSALYVGVHIREGTTTVTTVTALTYNGLTVANFTLVGSHTSPLTGTRDLTLYIYRALPGSACDGANHTLAVTLSAAKIFGVGVMALNGVDQADPEDTAVVKATNGTTAINGETGNVPSAAGDLVLGWMAHRNITVLATVSGQTDRYDFVTTHSSNPNNVRGIGATEPGAATVEIGWTTGVANEWIAMGINVNASTGRRRSVPPRQFLQHHKEPLYEHVRY